MRNAYFSRRSNCTRVTKLRIMLISLKRFNQIRLPREASEAHWLGPFDNKIKSNARLETQLQQLSLNKKCEEILTRKISRFIIRIIQWTARIRTNTPNLTKSEISTRYPENNRQRNTNSAIEMPKGAGIPRRQYQFHADTIPTITFANFQNNEKENPDTTTDKSSWPTFP